MAFFMAFVSNCNKMHATWSTVLRTAIKDWDCHLPDLESLAVHHLCPFTHVCPHLWHGKNCTDLLSQSDLFIYLSVTLNTLSVWQMSRGNVLRPYTPDISPHMHTLCLDLLSMAITPLVFFIYSYCLCQFSIQITASVITQAVLPIHLCSFLAACWVQWLLKPLKQTAADLCLKKRERKNPWDLPPSAGLFKQALPALCCSCL